MLDSLNLIRKKFNEVNPDLFEKIEIYKERGTITSFLGSHEWDYIHFSETLSEGFQSLQLQHIFEVLIYLHFFKSVYSLNIDFNDYIKFDKFEKEKYINISTEHANIVMALNIVEKWCNDALKEFGIKPEEILENEKTILTATEAIQHGKRISLNHFGDKQYIVSKIPFKQSTKPFDKTLVRFNHHIYYTFEPAQIINFAHAAEPGVYLIANVPYGKKAETAFYVLFRQTEYAYLVENCKHSYREQYYRGRTDGTPGEDAWLYKKYEYDYFPINIVLDFFEKKTESKEISKKENLQFISLGKITDCDYEIILYNYAFVDKCISYFVKEEFTNQITNAVSPEFIVPSMLSSTEKANLPAVYSPFIPDIKKMDLTWNPETVQVEDQDLAHLEKQLPKASIDKIKLPTGSLTSAEQIRRHLIFQLRMNQAKELADKIVKDWKKNFTKVMNHIRTFVKQKGYYHSIVRALEDKEYERTMFRQFADKLEYDEKGRRLDLSRVLYCRDMFFHADVPHSVEGHLQYFTNAPDPNHPVRNYVNFRQMYPHKSRSIWLTDNAVQQWETCVVCNTKKTRYKYTVQFIDYKQFKGFFELTEKEDKSMPFELKTYLNQIEGKYGGNSILDDIDPLAMIENPWWVEDPEDESFLRSSTKTPTIWLEFGLCGHCKKKAEKGQI